MSCCWAILIVYATIVAWAYLTRSGGEFLDDRTYLVDGVSKTKLVVRTSSDTYVSVLNRVQGKLLTLSYEAGRQINSIEINQQTGEMKFAGMWREEPYLESSFPSDGYIGSCWPVFIRQGLRSTWCPSGPGELVEYQFMVTAFHPNSGARHLIRYERENGTFSVTVPISAWYDGSLRDKFEATWTRTAVQEVETRIPQPRCLHLCPRGPRGIRGPPGLPEGGAALLPDPSASL